MGLPGLYAKKKLDPVVKSRGAVVKPRRVMAKPQRSVQKLQVNTQNTLPLFSTLLVRDDTGEVLHALHSDTLVYPASLTKMMTLYLIFKKMKERKVCCSTFLTTSKLATQQAPSRLNLKQGEKIRLEDAIRALIVKSANDVAVVVAEGVGGSVGGFATLMNKEAVRLGMKHTHFFNPSGLPDKRHVTTASDMVILSRKLYHDFPEYVHFFKLKSFSYKGKVYHSHNKVLKKDPSIDGIKTGFINASGFNISTSAIRKDKKGKFKRLFLVVIGGETRKKRDEYVHEWLEKGFEKVLN